MRTTGYAVDEAIGRNPRLLNAGKTPPATYADLWDTLGRGEDADGDYSMVVDGRRHRFRVNATAIQIDDRPGAHLVFRVHPGAPPPLAALGIPAALEKVLLAVRKGLVLVTGPTGSGKTTLLAATVRRILEGLQASGNRPLPSRKR